MTVTPEVVAEVLDEYNKNPQRFSPFRTSKVLGVPITDVLEIVENNRELTSRSSEKFDGYGPPAMQKYVVGRRKAMSSGWDNENAAIAEARRNYELGTHDMITGRDGPWLLLYSIPRRKRQPRPNYFHMEPV